MLGDSGWYKKVDELSGRVTRLIGLSASTGLVFGAFHNVDQTFSEDPDLIKMGIKIGFGLAGIIMLALTFAQLHAASVLVEDSTREYFSFGKDKDGKDLVWGHHFVLLFAIQVCLLIAMFAVFSLVRSVSAG